MLEERDRYTTEPERARGNGPYPSRRGRFLALTLPYLLGAAVAGYVFVSTKCDRCRGVVEYVPRTSEPVVSSEIDSVDNR